MLNDSIICSSDSPLIGENECIPAQFIKPSYLEPLKIFFYPAFRCLLPSRLKPLILTFPENLLALVVFDQKQEPRLWSC